MMIRENSDLKARLDKAGVKATQAKEQPRTNTEEILEKELRAVNLHYLTKIEAMEKELKKKEITIQSYQEKIVQLNNRLAGDGERVKLMDKMKQDIEVLQRKREEG